MKIGILLNSDNQLCDYSEIFRQIIIINDLPFIIVDPNSESLLEDLKSCTHLVFRHSQGDTDPLFYDVIFNIATRVENIRCMPDYPTFWPYEDKTKEYYLLKSNGFPVVDSRVFWNEKPAREYLVNAQYPIVAKLPKGAGSTNVVIVKSKDEGQRIVNQVFGRGVRTGGLDNGTSLTSLQKKGLVGYTKRKVRLFLIREGLIRDHTRYPEWQIQKDSILFQRFLPGNTFDTRITVIGRRALAFRRFVRDNDFRASGSGKLNFEMDMIDRRCIEIAFSVTKKLNLTTMTFDFIFDENKNPWINEMSYCFVDRFVGRCPGYWDDNLIWHEGTNWPQYYQLSDFLGRDDLKSIPQS